MRSVSKSKRKQVNAICFTALSLAFFLICIKYFNDKIQPIASEIGASKAKSEASAIIKDSINGFLDENDIGYSDLVTIIYDRDGNVASIETMTNYINEVNAELSAEIYNNLKDGLDRTINIPAGTISGLPLFSGRGPNIKIKIMPVGNVQTKLRNEFFSAGINQTVHRIILDITAEITIVYPFKVTDIEVSADYILAETVIVGKVPFSS